MAPKSEKNRGRTETQREEKRSLINNFWTATAHRDRNLERMGLPKDEEFLSTLDPRIRSRLMDNWVDRVPPPQWGQCLLCHAKGDMVDMFFCVRCGTVVHPKCMDADPVNDARLIKWKCPACIRRDEEQKGASSSARMS